MGKEVVVTLGGGTTVRPSGALADTEFASVIWTVKVLVPVTVGVPEITPVAGARDKPVGKVPDETDQE